MTANEKQVGGTHYKTDGEEHWDRVHRLKMDYFQGQITKYVERCWKKNGLQDLHKARHFLDKYIELHEGKGEVKLSADMSGFTETLAKIAEAGARAAEQQQGRPLYGPPGHLPVCPTPKGPCTCPADVSLAPQLYPEVDPLSGWVNFQFEGSDANGSLWRCRKCSGHFRTPVHARPDDYHPCRLDSTQPEEPGPAYTNQG